MAEQSVNAKAEGEAFLQQFDEISRRVIKPTIEAVITRLRKDGGDGSIAERGLDAPHSPRVILWMSLPGEISPEPHQDRRPFLQLDADSAHRRVEVWEGDMWDKQGSSRATEPWELIEISPESTDSRSEPGTLCGTFVRRFCSRHRRRPPLTPGPTSTFHVEGEYLVGSDSCSNRISLIEPDLECRTLLG
jgi:hypothetical protein